MKTQTRNQIENLLNSGKPLTDSQVKMVAYWEFVDFQSKSDWLLGLQGLKTKDYSVVHDPVK
jgi:hypothetical protein